MNKIFYILLPLVFTTTACQTPKEDTSPIEPVKIIYSTNPFVFTRILKRIITSEVSIIEYKSPSEIISHDSVICDITIRYIRGDKNRYRISVNDQTIGSIPYNNPPHSIRTVKKIIYHTYRYRIKDAIKYVFVIQRTTGRSIDDIFIESIRIERL